MNLDQGDINAHFKKGVKPAAGVTYTDTHETINGGQYQPKGTKYRMTKKEYESKAGHRFNSGIAAFRDRPSKGGSQITHLLESQPVSPANSIMNQKESCTFLPEADRIGGGTPSRTVLSAHGSRPRWGRNRLNNLNSGREKMINYSGIGLNMLVGSGDVSMDKGGAFFQPGWSPASSLIPRRGSRGVMVTEPHSPEVTAVGVVSGRLGEFGGVTSVASVFHGRFG